MQEYLIANNMAFLGNYVKNEHEKLMNKKDDILTHYVILFFLNC